MAPNNLRSVNLFLLLFCTFLPIFADAPSRASLLWSIVYKNTDAQIMPIDFDAAATTLSQSDKLKVYLRHDPDVYLYLFLHDTEDNLFLLYPSSFAKAAGVRRDSIVTFIPEGPEWFEFEEGSGTERFYLFASTERQKSLEEFVKTFEKIASTRKQDQLAITMAKENLLGAIRSIQLENYDILKKSNEDMVLAAGEFRGLEENFEFPARRVDFEEFYARTIRIAH